jgi:hypothetical protein
MATRQLVIDVPETVLLAEKMDATAFAQELRVLASPQLFYVFTETRPKFHGLREYRFAWRNSI